MKTKLVATYIPGISMNYCLSFYSELYFQFFSYIVYPKYRIIFNVMNIYNTITVFFYLFLFLLETDGLKELCKILPQNR
jgi:hypothetical protein